MVPSTWQLSTAQSVHASDSLTQCQEYALVVQYCSLHKMDTGKTAVVHKCMNMQHTDLPGPGTDALMSAVAGAAYGLT